MLLHSLYNRKPASGELLSHFAIVLQNLLSKAMPDLDDKNKTVLLRAQLGAYLPEHMRALIQFNQSKSWDDLLNALDLSMPHVAAHLNASNTNSSFHYDAISGLKNEPIEACATSASYKFNCTCHYCKKPGHKISDCFKRKQENEQNSGGNVKKGDKSRGFSSNNKSSRH